jgi:hypothetical protein
MTGCFHSCAIWGASFDKNQADAILVDFPQADGKNSWQLTFFL